MTSGRLDVGGGILSGPEIERQVKLGHIEVDPFEPAHINPASIDLTLGAACAVIRQRGMNDINPASIDLTLGAACAVICQRGMNVFPVDVADRGTWQSDAILPVAGMFRLSPGLLYLMHTRERVATKRYVPVLDGKSSLARLGVKVHETAGYGDPGYDGQYTLEVSVTLPTILRVGMRVAQMRFHTLVGEPLYYAGNYQGASGPVASRVHRQFEEEDQGR